MLTFLNIGNQGRLANQMFQFSATVGIARKNGYEPIFPIENFSSADPHSFEGGKLLECFDIPLSYFSNINKIIRSIEFNYQEPHFNFDPNSSRIPDNTNLNGYFQSQKYFAEVSGEILSSFTFRNNVIEAAHYLESSIDFEKSVSVHVRRGDYLSSPSHHPVQGIEYYREAFSRYQGLKKIIFSDDPAWCRENLDIDDVTVIEENNPYVTLYLMSRFKNHIISNSSFSWWGAWLSGENSSVISPKKWFGDSLPHDTSDLYPDGWVKI